MGRKTKSEKKMPRSARKISPFQETKKSYRGSKNGITERSYRGSKNKRSLHCGKVRVCSGNKTKRLRYRGGNASEVVRQILTLEGDMTRPKAFDILRIARENGGLKGLRLLIHPDKNIKNDEGEYTTATQLLNSAIDFFDKNKFEALSNLPIIKEYFANVVQGKEAIDVGLVAYQTQDDKLVIDLPNFYYGDTARFSISIQYTLLIPMTRGSSLTYKLIYPIVEPYLHEETVSLFCHQDNKKGLKFFSIRNTWSNGDVYDHALCIRDSKEMPESLPTFISNFTSTVSKTFIYPNLDPLVPSKDPPQGRSSAPPRGCRWSIDPIMCTPVGQQS